MHKIVMIYTSREVYEYISKQTNDLIVERKTCAISGTQFPIYQSDLDFYTKISPTFAGEKFQIPTPTLCPEERQRRRLSFRNERKLYKRTCDATGDQIISIYSPDKSYKVYNQKFWRSDARDPMDYGKDFDFTKSFTEQFGELMRIVPRLSLINMNSEGSDYCNPGYFNKNCYMVHSITNSSNCLYGRWVDDCDNCIDCLCVKNSRFSYFCIMGENLYQCVGCINCKDCNNCLNCYDLIGKQFCIKNIQYSKEEYFEYIQNNGRKVEIEVMMNYNDNLSSYNNDNLSSYNNDNCEDCVLITNSSDCRMCLDVDGGENLSYCNFCKPGAKNCIDNSLLKSCEYIRECMSALDQYFCVGSIFCRNSQYIFYSDHCKDSSNLFGCIGLRNKQYCIFNKQYTKEDYEILVGKIIRHLMSTGERGEFFHPSLSPFGYNETVAQEYYPLSQDLVGTHGNASDNQQNKIALFDNNILYDGIDDGCAKCASLQQIDYSQFGYHRSTYSSDPKIPEGVKTIDCGQPEWAEDSPARIELNQTVLSDLATSQPSNISYDICKQIILCEVSGRPFMLQKAEIDFYRKHHISLPRKHPDIRHEERMKLRPGRTLYLRNCDCCGKEMLSVYPNDRRGGYYPPVHGNASDQQVYCESCYQKEIYG